MPIIIFLVVVLALFCGLAYLFSTTTPGKALVQRTESQLADVAAAARHELTDGTRGQVSYFVSTSTPSPTATATATPEPTATNTPRVPIVARSSETPQPARAPVPAPSEPLSAEAAGSTVRQYLQALNDGKAARALTYWAPASEASARDFIDLATRRGDKYEEQDLISRTESDLGYVEVTIALLVTPGDGKTATSVRQVYQLQRIDGGLYIVTRTQ